MLFGVALNATYITVTPSQALVNQGQVSELISNVSSGISPYTYQWFEKEPIASNYMIVTGATGLTYDFVTNDSTSVGTWNFMLQVTDSIGEVANSTAVSVLVNSIGNHGPIIINGNSQFTSANGVTGRSGTINDPYIIDNWIINASGTTTPDIQILNTNAYVIVRNCTLLNNQSEFMNGITLYNVQNAILTANTFNSDWEGILVTDSTNNTIANNYFENCANDGVLMGWLTANFLIANNTVSNCCWGINLNSFATQLDK